MGGGAIWVVPQEMMWGLLTRLTSNPETGACDAEQLMKVGSSWMRLRMRMMLFVLRNLLGTK